MALLNLQRGFPTDKITFRKDQITQIITVLDIPESRVGAKLVDMYTMILLQNRSTSELLKLSKEHYRKMERKTYEKKTGDIDEFGNEIKTRTIRKYTKKKHLPSKQL
jgi:ribosome-associated heat shock protein Hsp15